jgi:hypothetical protein
MKIDEMVGACSTHERYECVHVTFSRHRREYDIKMYVKETWYVVAYWIRLVQDNEW